MDDMTRANTLSQCHVRHCYTCVQIRENVTCEGVLFTRRVQTHTKSTVTLPGESHFQVLVHFSGRLRLCTKAQKEANLLFLEKETAATLALPRSSPPAPQCAKQCLMINGFHHAKTTMVTHQNDELLRHEPAHVAHRQPEAVPEEPEEQGIDVLQVVSEPQLSKSNACLNFHHFENSELVTSRES